MTGTVYIDMHVFADLLFYSLMQSVTVVITYVIS